MNRPKAYDDETESLLTWYRSEIERRGLTSSLKVVA